MCVQKVKKWKQDDNASVSGYGNVSTDNQEDRELHSSVVLSLHQWVWDLAQHISLSYHETNRMECKGSN